MSTCASKVLPGNAEYLEALRAEHKRLIAERVKERRMLNAEKPKPKVKRAKRPLTEKQLAMKEERQRRMRRRRMRRYLKKQRVQRILQNRIAFAVRQVCREERRKKRAANAEKRKPIEQRLRESYLEGLQEGRRLALSECQALKEREDNEVQQSERHLQSLQDEVGRG